MKISLKTVLMLLLTAVPVVLALQDVSFDAKKMEIWEPKPRRRRKNWRCHREGRR